MVTVTSMFFQPVGASDVVPGAVRSILIPDTVVLVELLALSPTEALAERFAPSPVIVLSAGTIPGLIPDKLPAAVQWIATSPLYQPSALGCVVAAPPSDGAVLSTFMPLTVVPLLLPAAS